MSTFLEIATAVNKKLGTQGTILDVTSPTYYQSIIIQSINDGYLELQLYRDNWKWMSAIADFDMVVDQRTYDPDNTLVVSSANFGKWDTDMILYHKSTGKSQIREQHYDNYVLRDYENQPSGTPSTFAVHPVTKALLFNTPDETYSIEAHYYITPEQLEINSDVPILPAKFHNLLVYRATEETALSMGDHTKHVKYQTMYNKMLGQLMREENPKKVLTQHPFV